MQDGVAQALHLAGRPVARVHLDRAVGGVGIEVARRRNVGPQVVLDLRQESTQSVASGRPGRIDGSCFGDSTWFGRRQENSALTVGPPPRAQERVEYDAAGPVVGAQQVGRWWRGQ